MGNKVEPEQLARMIEEAVRRFYVPAVKDHVASIADNLLRWHAQRAVREYVNVGWGRLWSLGRLEIRVRWRAKNG